LYGEPIKALARMYCTMLLLFGFFFAPQSVVPKTIYEFKVTAIDSSIIDFSKFRGKKILIVNTASKCGFTPQYEGLQRLSEKYKDNLVIVGFPANNFFFQEPGSNKHIAGVCKIRYGVTFPMAAKISVKGRKMAPIYHWLTEKEYNGFEDSKVAWNFQKYLIDETGHLVAIFPTKTDPESPEVIQAIETKK
jgi:glutathione peroxidase